MTVSICDIGKEKGILYKSTSDSGAVSFYAVKLKREKEKEKGRKEEM